MNKILKIQLINFQKHEDLTVNFNDDITVIAGKSFSGKTCVYRALEYLCNFSSVSEKDFRREGSKSTTVKGWFSNGFIVERTRSNSINRYILSKEGMDNKQFDKFGKDTPDEIKQAIGFDAIELEKETMVLNFANQDHMNFLIDSTYSDIFKAQLFNKLTGNELLDKVFKELNRESLRISRELDEYKTKVENQKEELVECSQKHKACKEKLNNAKEKYVKIKEDVEIYNHLKKLAEQLSDKKNTQNEIQEKINTIKFISEDKIKKLKNKVEQLKNLKELEENLNKVKTQINDLNCIEYKIVDVDFNKLKQKSNEIEIYKELQNKLQEIRKKQNETNEKMRRIKDIITANNAELKELWDKQEICPLCKQEVNHG